MFASILFICFQMENNRVEKILETKKFSSTICVVKISLILQISQVLYVSSICSFIRCPVLVNQVPRFINFNFKNEKELFS